MNLSGSVTDFFFSKADTSSGNASPNPDRDPLRGSADRSASGDGGRPR